MRIQLWSYNYDPEQIGIGPVSGTIARELASRGDAVEVVTAHPHYPEPQWGSRFLPYHEDREGISVLRVPIWVGRASAAERIRQELSYAAAATVAMPALGNPDVILAVSPSFPGLAPVMLNARLRRVPWVLWLQDILPDGAIVTDILDEGVLTRAARRFERAAYASAKHIVVISDSFEDNLRAKGVPDEKITRLYNPATRPVLSRARRVESNGVPSTVLTMGNIGRTQNLAELARAFERSEELADLGARFVITGEGLASGEVRAAISTDRVQLTGILDTEQLERQLDDTALGIVSQRYDGREFNVPSKLMNFMARGVPVVAAVPGESEVARILRSSKAGWIVDSGDPNDFAAAIAAALRDKRGRERRGKAALSFARTNFAPGHVASGLEKVLTSVVAGSRTAQLSPVHARGSGNGF